MSRSFLRIIILLAFVLAAEAQVPRQFRAGAATSNVTPWLGVSINGGMQDRTATHIHDELHARALVLDNGEMQLAFVVVDSCMLPREISDEAKRLAHQHTGIPAEHILVSATHTHSAPTAAPIFQSHVDAEYLRFLSVRIADAVRRAVNHLQPAKIGWGVGKVPGQVFNRRWKMKPGTIPPNPFGGIDQVKMNPPAGSPDLIEPAGPTDPDLSIISVQALNGRPIALLANYSLHYVGGTGSGHISADYFGMFAERIEDLLRAARQDPPFVGIMSNGTSGNINNINFRHPRQQLPPYAQMRRVAEVVAAEALRVHEAIAFHDWVALGADQTELDLGVRLPSEEDVEKAKQAAARAQGPAMRTPEEIYARETVLLGEYPPRVSLILQALRIGDVGIAAIPCEVFVEIGLELKQKSPFTPTFTISLANGYNGYLPTVEHHQLGGYETWRARSSYLEVQAAPKILKTLLKLLSVTRSE